MIKLDNQDNVCRKRGLRMIWAQFFFFLNGHTHGIRNVPGPGTESQHNCSSVGSFNLLRPARHRRRNSTPLQSDS